jgi:HD-like signal output (HDOD) protein
MSSYEVSEYAIYRRVVSQLMQGEEQLPSLPTITLDIRRSLVEPQTTITQLVKLVSRDPALSALLMKHACSALHRQSRQPQSLHDVIQLLGMREVDRITMAHSIKSLFTLHSPAHKELFVASWQRLALKASTCAMLARLLSRITPEHALLASLLSEVGTLAVLSAFKDEDTIPSRELYFKLCREYSKPLSIIVLKKWAVANEYIEVIRNTGHWHISHGQSLDLTDLVNLALYHALKERDAASQLPPLTALAAYQKLFPPQDFIGENGELDLVIQHRGDIQAIAQGLH